MGGALHKALDKAGLILDLGHVRLGADDDVAHALAGDAVVLGDLGERQVLVVVKLVKFLLPLGEEFAVEVKEHRHAKGLIFHGESSFEYSV